jgi:hypothetical protein
VKNSLFGYDFKKEIATGEAEASAISKVGSPAFRLPLNQSETMMLYNSGYFIVKNGLVTVADKYSNIHSRTENLESDIMTGTTAIEAISALGTPSKATIEKDGLIIEYASGAIFIRDGVVVGSSNKIYEDDLNFFAEINGFRDQEQEIKGAYYISPGEKSISENDLLFKEAKEYIAKALHDTGHTTTDNLDSADFVLLVQFGISDPKERVDVVSRPVYLPQYNPGQTIGVFSGLNQVGTLQTSGSWSTNYAGQSTETVRTITYSRWLNLQAFNYKEFKKSGSFNPLWKTMATSEGSSRDIRYILPGLVVVTKLHLGEDTKLLQTYRILPTSANGFVYSSKFEKTMKRRNIAGKLK